MIVTALRFNQIGEALFGDDWEACMAKRLRVSRKTVQRWRRGETKFNPKYRDKLFDLIELHCEQVTALRAILNGRK